MGDFKYQQRERLIVENEIKYWANRWKKTEHPQLKREIELRVEDFICFYETQIPCLEYHLNRFERLKGLH